MNRSTSTTMISRTIATTPPPPPPPPVSTIVVRSVSRSSSAMETLPVPPVVDAQRAAAGPVPDGRAATMRLKTAALCLFVVTFPACNRAEKEATNLAPAEVVKNENPPATATEARVEGVLPNDRTPLAEPKGPIDPKSIEAAGQVVQHYGALI